MYASARDHFVLSGWSTIREGLDALGLDAVEMNLERDNTVFAVRPLDGKDRFKLDDPADLDAFRKHLSENEVRVSALLMANDYGSDDLDGEVAWTIAAIRAADTLGIPAVRIDAMMHGEGEDAVEKNIRVFTEAMHRVLGATSDSKIDLGIENHGYQGNRVDFLDEIFARVGSPRLGLTIDTGNFYWYGHPLSRMYEIIEHFAPRCKHTHAKNIKYPEDKREIQREVGWEYGTYVSPIPDGDVDHARVVRILKAAGYDRDLCLEDESLGNWEGDERRAVMLRDAEYVRGIL
jgi:sugar phosphate isomerase/epimerase